MRRIFDVRVWCHNVKSVMIFNPDVTWVSDNMSSLSHCVSHLLGSSSGAGVRAFVVTSLSAL